MGRNRKEEEKERKLPTHNYNLRSKTKSSSTLPTSPVTTQGKKARNIKKDLKSSLAKKEFTEMDDDLTGGKRPRKRKAPEPRRIFVSPPRAHASNSRLYIPSERTPKATFQDLAAIDDIVKNAIQKVVLPFANPKTATVLGCDVPKGLLLTGKPGTGKTMLADAIVNEIRKIQPEVRYFQEVNQCLSKWVGESEQHIRDLFEFAHQNGPSVIFMDELDGISKCRMSGKGQEGVSVVQTLLTEINEIEKGQVLVIAATNCEGLVDPAIIRRGRFDITINIPVPNPDGIREILRHYLDRKQLTVEEKKINQMVRDTSHQGFTGADFEYLVNRIASNTLSRLFPEGEWVKYGPEEPYIKNMLKKLKRPTCGDIFNAVNSLVETELDFDEVEE